ncbi:putative ferric-chelate reductase 1 [Erpetoichthys calabaricus]|uniref:putative ferric-chelate reductase 1 n=1 Tax=Erpetoichthys calabaricus TaxID=27687 RepID=UPI002234226F|nr:putative ferric-chelate reductase 1 [Erpetoichthys calabaricus]
MMPSHACTAQTSNPPYTITPDKTVYKEGDQITVTLRAQMNAFQGFILEARQIGGSTAVGTFNVTNPADSQTLQCLTANSAVTHISNSPKAQIQVIWFAPVSPNLGNLEFRASVVENLTVFWVDVKSLTVKSVLSRALATQPNTVTYLPILMVSCFHVICSWWS